MKLSGAKIEAFLKAPDPKARLILVYGPDGGLVRERVQRLLRGVVPDLSDPFRFVDIAAASLKDDPARLADEAAALCLTGGRRAVVVRDAGDNITGLCQSYLAHPAGDALLVLEGGDLGPRSTLRKALEGAENGVALPCYADDSSSLQTLVVEELKSGGLSAEPDAMAYLVDHLGGDRRLSRAELQKLVLYMGQPGRVTLADATACIGDSAALSLDDLVFSTADGDTDTALRIADKMFREGNNPVMVLRSLSRHFQRLHLVAGHMAQGRSVEQAVGSLKPPVMFKVADRFRRQAGRWSLDRLARALDLLTQAEADCKSTGLPAEEMCSRAILLLSRAVERPGSRPARR